MVIAQYFNLREDGIKMNNLKSKSITWVYIIVLVLLNLITIYWLGYEHFNNPEEPFGILVLNLFLISIPLILFYGSVGLILFTMRQKALNGVITPPLSRVLYYTPDLRVC